MEKIVVFIDNANVSALGIVKVKNYDDRFDEAADDARFKAVNEINNIDDLLPAIMKNLENAGYQMEKLDHHEVSV